MTFTYSSTSVTTDLAKVRLMIQDTDSNHALMTDEEIDAMLTLNGGVYEAAAQCCEVIAARFARLIDRSAFSVSDSPGRSADSYLALAKQLRAQSTRSAEVFFGGRTKSGKEDLAEDSDKIQPIFSIGQDDAKGTNQHSSHHWEDYSD